MEQKFLIVHINLVLTKTFPLTACPFMDLINWACDGGPYLLTMTGINWKVSLYVRALQWAGVGVSGTYLRSLWLVLNKLSKAANGKSDKAYGNAASFSKMQTWNRYFSKIFNTKVGDTFKVIQVQHKSSHIKCFYFIISEECYYHGSD